MDGMWIPLFDVNPALRADVAGVAKWCLIFAHHRGVNNICTGAFTKLNSTLKKVSSHSLSGISILTM